MISKKDEEQFFAGLKIKENKNNNALQSRGIVVLGIS